MEFIIGKREQINQVSSYIDASHIYGVTEDEAKKLRSFKYGNLSPLKFSREMDGFAPHFSLPRVKGSAIHLINDFHVVTQIVTQHRG